MATKQEIYDKLFGLYKHTVDNEYWRRWREESEQAWNFYDGEQWTDQEVAALLATNQAAVVINQIAPRIDAVAGTEVQNRMRFTYKPRSTNPKDYVMAEALTTLGTQVQEMGDAGEAKSETFKSALISGIGVMEITKGNTALIEFNNVDDRELIYDVDDMSSDMSKSRYRGLAQLADIDDVKAQFPASAKKIEDMIAGADTTGSAEGHKTSEFGMGVETNDFDAPFSFLDNKRNKMLVVTMQYKKPTTYYRYIGEDEREKETSSKELAIQRAGSEDGVEEVVRDEIWVGYFAKDILLAHYKMPYQTGDFSIRVFVYKRRKTDGVPYGIVKAAIDPQKEINKRRSKMMHILNNRQIIADTNAFENPEDARKEAARPDGVLLKRRGTEVQIRDNLSLAESQFRVMQQAQQDIQSVTGITDEFMGMQTNATSGLAINQRANNTAKVFSSTFDRLGFFNKQMGRAILEQMKATIPENFIVHVIDEDTPEKSKSIILNEVSTDNNGDIIQVSDLHTAQFDVAVTEEPDVDVPMDEIRNSLTQLLMNGQLQVLAVPELAKILAPRYSDKISAGVQSLLGASQPQAEGGAPTQAGGGNNTPA